VLSVLSKSLRGKNYSQILEEDVALGICNFGAGGGRKGTTKGFA